mgnify:CR=1 FL=1
MRDSKSVDLFLASDWPLSLTRNKYGKNITKKCVKICEKYEEIGTWEYVKNMKKFVMWKYVENMKEYEGIPLTTKTLGLEKIEPI